MEVPKKQYDLPPGYAPVKGSNNEQKKRLFLLIGLIIVIIIVVSIIDLLYKIN